MNMFEPINQSKYSDFGRGRDEGYRAGVADERARCIEALQSLRDEEGRTGYINGQEWSLRAMDMLDLAIAALSATPPVSPSRENQQ